MAQKMSLRLYCLLVMLIVVSLAQENKKEQAKPRRRLEGAPRGAGVGKAQPVSVNTYEKPPDTQEEEEKSDSTRVGFSEKVLLCATISIVLSGL